MSSVGGQASVAIGLKGLASTIVGEAEIGLTLLGQAVTFLAQRPSLDALVVLAADELAPVFLAMGQTVYGLPPLPLAEGAVALVLERRGAALTRGAAILAEIAGVAQTSDGLVGTDEDGVWLEHAIRTTLIRAGETPAGVDLAMTQARGDRRLDQRETLTLGRLFSKGGPAIRALSDRAGWAEASGSLLSVAMAVMALQHGRVPGQAEPSTAPIRTALVAGSSRHGSNAAVLLRRPHAVAA